MRRMRIPLHLYGPYAMVAVLFLLCGASSVYAANPPDDASAQRLIRGKRIYLQQCAGCHGEDGEATSRGESTKTLPGIGIRRSDFVIAHRLRGFITSIVTDEERADMVAYVKTLKGAKGYENPEYLINATALTPFITELDVRIVDLRSAAAYAGSHLPNAVHFDAFSLRPMPDAETFARLMEDIGVGDDTYVVVYDDDGGRSAALLWTTLHHYGHSRVSVLDGGWGVWVRDGRYITKWKPSKRTVTFTPRLQSGIFTRVPAKDGALVRVTVQSSGKSVPIDWSRNLQSDGAFRPAPELLAFYAAAGVPSGSPLITVSGDPSAAAQVMFTLRLLGYPDVRMSAPGYQNQKAQTDAWLRQVIGLR